MKPYPSPRIGLFEVNSPDNTYTLKDGWQQVQKRAVIIGEDHDTYITQVMTSARHLWYEGFRYDTTVTVPLGIHKSRLIRWFDIMDIPALEYRVSTQLTLF